MSLDRYKYTSFMFEWLLVDVKYIYTQKINKWKPDFC